MNLDRRMLMVCLVAPALLLGCGGNGAPPPAEPPPAEPPPASVTSPPPAQIVESVPVAPPEDTTPARHAEPYDGEDAAYLTLNARPWATIYLDGEMVRNTPLVDWAIAPGSHTLLLRCGNCVPPQEKTQEFSVEPGETHVSVRNEFGTSDR